MRVAVTPATGTTGEILHDNVQEDDWFLWECDFEMSDSGGFLC